MNIVQALILSLIEGVTEFLPISSTGHLILAGKILGILPTEFVKSFEIIIQFGAILAVVFLYFQTIIKNFKIWGRIFIAFVPTGIVGLLAYRFVKNQLLGNQDIVIFSLFFGGIAILILEKFFNNKSNKITSIENLSLGRSAVIGSIQSISVIPGVSRAMVTIFGGLSVGLSRKNATEFSFFLAIPTMFAAASLDLVKTNFLFTGREYFILLIGFTGAFVSALISMKYFLNYIQKHSFKIFAVYRIILAIIFWLIY